MKKGKIELEKVSMKNIERIYELFANDKVLVNLLMPLHAKELTLENEKVWARKTIANYRKKQPESYDLSIIIDGEVAGVVGLPKIDWKNNKAEIGYWLGEQYWGKGYMTKTVKLFLKHVDKKFGFKRYEIRAFGYNKASMRIAEKCGFKHEGTHKKAIKKWGKYIDDTCFALVR